METVTKKDLDEAMEMVTNAFEKVVTTEGLRQELKNYPTKDDLRNELKKFATKEDLTVMKDDMKSMFESAIERIEDSILVQQRDQERRITVLEKQR